MQLRVEVRANERELVTVPADALANATGGFWDRVSAVVGHDELVATRVGNRLGDRLGLASKGPFGDNLLGEIGGAAGFFYGALHGELSALVNPSHGDRLLQRWGGNEDINGPRR